MIKDIKGLHHVTSMASDARQNNRFFTDTLGLRRVKQTVNFDDPSVYHLYYGDETGSAGTVMTYFPFPNMMLSRPGVGEVGEIQVGAEGLAEVLAGSFTAQTWTVWNWTPSSARTGFRFMGPDADALALIESSDDKRGSLACRWNSDDGPSAVFRVLDSAFMTLLRPRSCLASWAISAPK